MNDRIKLAEAMGATVAPITLEDCGGPFLITFDPASTEAEMDKAQWQGFDPFTDANDDYAVLEWMRDGASKYSGKDSKHYKIYQAYWTLPDAQHYKVGDYARAALKVIEHHGI